MDEVRPIQWEPKTVTVPVSEDVMKSFGVTDSTVLKKSSMSWMMNNTVSFQGVKAVRVQDLMVKDIIESNNWQRPIYFAVTCSHDSKIGLHEYLQLEGMAYRLVPYRTGVGNINTEVLDKQLFNEPEGYSKDYQPGFKFRGLNDTTMFLDENHSRMLMNYRNAYLQYAVYHLNNKNNEKCIAILDEMERKLPRDIILIDYRYLFDIGKMYYQAGAMDKYREVAADIEEVATRMIEEDPTAVTQQYNPYQMLIEIYSNLQEYDKAIKLLNDLLKYYPDNQSILNQIQYMEEMKKADDMLKQMQQMQQDTTAAEE
jgi:tetratricopeptide (TPR) repeat protein